MEEKTPEKKSKHKWFVLEQNDKSISDFLDSNWGFHDFRIERVSYDARVSVLCVFLKYDTEEEGVLLVFSKVADFQMKEEYGYEASYIPGSVIIWPKGASLMTWIAEDSWTDNDGDYIRGIKENASWVRAEELYWAVTDEDGNPIEMPKNRVDQVWVSCFGDKSGIKKHFELKPLENDTIMNMLECRSQRENKENLLCYEECKAIAEENAYVNNTTLSKAYEIDGAYVFDSVEERLGVFLMAINRKSGNRIGLWHYINKHGLSMDDMVEREL